MPESSDIPELSLEKDIATPQTESIDVIKGNLLAEASSEREVAEREVIRDERGNVQDIAFKLNGNRMTLKQLFPGDYSIDFAINNFLTVDDVDNYFDMGTDSLSVTLTRDTEPFANLLIMHEAGHAADFAQRHELLSKMNRQYLETGARAWALKCLRGLPPEQSKMELKEMILKQFPYGEDLQEKLVDRVHAELIQVAKMGEEEKAKIVSEADNTFFKTRANLSLETERPAWAIALKGIREMRANGINLYAGLNTEMFEEIDDALDTYQESDGKYLDEGNYFVRSRRPKTE